MAIETNPEFSVGTATPIPVPGYVFIYVNNNSSSSTPVYFDDLKVTQLHSPYVAGGDFYPFGLAMDDRQIKVEPYRFGYQGQYAEKDSLANWNAFQLRMYEPRFGRWLTVDPYGQFDSPYIAMGNNPASYTDPDGGIILPEVTITAARGVSMWVISVANAVAVSLQIGLARAGGFANGFNVGMGVNSSLVSLVDPNTQAHSAQYAEAQAAGLEFGQAFPQLMMMRVTGETMTPGTSPMFATPRGPVTRPMGIPITTLLDVHGRVYSDNPENTQWGWTGSKTWKDLVQKVKGGGTITDLNGKIPTKTEAIKLIEEGGGKVDRIEAGHADPNPHQYNHINYTTNTGIKGTIKIQGL